jgi:hypothetical protein
VIRGAAAGLLRRCEALEAENRALQESLPTLRRAAAAAAARAAAAPSHFRSPQSGNLESAGGGVSRGAKSIASEASRSRSFSSQLGRASRAPPVSRAVWQPDSDATLAAEAAAGLPSPSELRLREQVRALRGAAAGRWRRLEALEAENRALREAVAARRSAARVGRDVARARRQHEDSGGPGWAVTDSDVAPGPSPGSLAEYWLA